MRDLKPKEHNVTEHMRTNLENPQLFLDDSWVEDCGHVERVWHQPRKYPDPVIRPEYPWERNGIVAYGSVLHWGGKFRAWYINWTDHTECRVCYAESDDGISWEKPLFDLHPWKAHARTNIVLESCAQGRGFIDDVTVIPDPDDARHPLKMLYWDAANTWGSRDPQPPVHGIHLAGSSDGVSWEKLGNVLPLARDRFNAVPARYQGKYIAFLRTREQRGRCVLYAESEDLHHWTEPEHILSSDTEDPANLEYYSWMAFPYADLLIGSIERMHRTPDVVDCELCWSRDGRKWHRARTRPAFLARGPQGHFDDTWTNLTASAPIQIGARLWFYYSGRNDAHAFPYPHKTGSIGLATLRKDGFCSLRALEQSGFIVTPAMTWPEGDLLVNVDCRRDADAHPSDLCHGDLYVEVLDAEGNPIPGFTREEADRIRTNTGLRRRHGPDLNAYCPVTWSGQKSLRELKGKPLKLRFILREAHLYAFKAGTWTEG